MLDQLVQPDQVASLDHQGSRERMVVLEMLVQEVTLELLVHLETQVNKGLPDQLVLKDLKEILEQKEVQVYLEHLGN